MERTTKKSWPKPRGQKRKMALEFWRHRIRVPVVPTEVPKIQNSPNSYIFSEFLRIQNFWGHCDSFIAMYFGGFAIDGTGYFLEIGIKFGECFL